ncbi:MAG: hypothetical protein Q8N26_25140 [Myxococcales bacterium]|nr:hypothetical protein [Myxococcales bacterium]
MLVPEPVAHIASVNVIVIDDCRQTVRSSCAERGQLRLPLAVPTFEPPTMFSATIALSVHSDGMTLLVEPPSSEPPAGPQATTKSENIGTARRTSECMPSTAGGWCCNPRGLHANNVSFHDGGRHSPGRAGALKTK